MDANIQTRRRPEAALGFDAAIERLRISFRGEFCCLRRRDTGLRGGYGTAWSTSDRPPFCFAPPGTTWSRP
jgi:hypothetical protein